MENRRLLRGPVPVHLMKLAFARRASTGALLPTDSLARALNSYGVASLRCRRARTKRSISEVRVCQAYRRYILISEELVYRRKGKAPGPTPYDGRSIAASRLGSNETAFWEITKRGLRRRGAQPTADFLEPDFGTMLTNPDGFTLELARRKRLEHANLWKYATLVMPFQHASFRIPLTPPSQKSQPSHTAWECRAHLLQGCTVRNGCRKAHHRVHVESGGDWFQESWLS